LWSSQFGSRPMTPVASASEENAVHNIRIAVKQF